MLGYYSFKSVNRGSLIFHAVEVSHSQNVLRQAHSLQISSLVVHCGAFFDEMLADSTDCTEGEGQTRNTAEIIVDMYLKEPVLACSEQIYPLTYWLGKKTLWPCLVDLASKYLSIPPSSVPSECLFSSAADIVSQERNRILPDKAEMLLFLKNLPVVGFLS